MHFTKRYRYRFGDIDDAGIGYYPDLLHNYHAAFEDWWADGVGIRYPDLLHGRLIGFPAVNLDVDFVSPVRYGDEPDVHTGVLRVGNASVEFGLWSTLDELGGGEPRLLSRARITTVCVAMDTMAKVRVPDDVRERFTAFTLVDGEWPSAGR